MFVATDPPSHLLASWTALEDIEADSGPLMYVPGSHRLPWFETDDDTIAFSGKSGVFVRAAWAEQRSRMIEENGLEVAEVACRQGDTFIWHAGLLHGGREIQNPDRTRKSFVVHYCTRDNYRSRTTKMAAPGERDGTWRTVKGETSEFISSGRYVGLQNPLLGVDTSG
jgi:ectoine hydroxylase-related dioxygenase (phytanoyl-CoA dioxygenase family)